jgi:mono/diheme cytochrome c family protein
MKALKTALVIIFAVFFSMACSTPSETGNKPAAPAANANTSTPIVVNSNQASQPTATAGGNSSIGAANPAASPADTAKTFNEKCALCHGEDGKGKQKGAPNFTNAEWQKKETDAEFTEIIKAGKKPMPGFAGKLSDDEIKALVGYVRSFAKK